MLVKNRIYVSLLLLSLVPVMLTSLFTYRVSEQAFEQLITRDFQSLAFEKAEGIGRAIDARINEVRLIAQHRTLIEAVKAANQRYADQSSEALMSDIHRLDQAWIQSKGQTELAEQIAANDLSNFLESIQVTRPEVYGEMFVTDMHGVTVAMTKTLSDYYQADEYWWQSGKTFVERGAFLDDRGYDESVGTIVIGVVVPIVDEGEVVGVFKINFKVKAILDIIAGSQLDEGYILLLARSDGSIIVSSDEAHPDQLAASELTVINEMESGTWSTDIHGSKLLASFYPMKHTFSTRHAKNATLGVTGETMTVKKWYVVYEVDHDLAFSSLTELKTTAIWVGLVALFFAILLGYVLSRSISKPLATLKRGTEIIGAGNLKHRIAVDERNEFGLLADSFNDMSKRQLATLASRDELNKEIEERKQVEQSLSRFKTTLDLTMDCVFMFEPKTLKFFYANRGGLQQVGYGMDDLHEMTPLDLTPEFDELSFHKLIDPLVSNPEHPLTYETLHRTKQGDLIPVEVFLQYIVPEAEEPRFVSIVRDITERKRQEEEKSKHFKVVSAYQDAIVKIAMNPASVLGLEDVVYPHITELVAKAVGVEQVSIWMLDEDGKEVGIRCVDRYEQSSDYHSQGTFLPASDYPTYFSALHAGQVLAAEHALTDPFTGEFAENYLKPQNIKSMLDAPVHLEGKLVGVICFESVGEERAWLQDDIAFAREVAGQLAQVVSNARRHNAEMDLDRAHALLQDVIDSMPSMLITVDGQRRITQWSQEAEKVTGIHAHKAIGMKLEDALCICNDVMQRVLELLEERQFSTLLRQECSLGGKKQYVDVTIYPLTSDKVEGTVIRLDYVTDRVRIESMMSQTEKMMSIGGLAAGMAHELNNPLGGILQSLQNIRRRFSKELPKNVSAAEALDLDLDKVHAYMASRQIDRFLNNVEHSSSQAASIVANLVKFIRHPDVGMMAENLPQLVDRTIELALMDYDMKKKYGFREVKLVREFDPSVVSTVCVASEIQQVILNGLRNAAQALSLQTDREEMAQITVRTTKRDDMACIEIEDNGPGMDEQTLSRVFEPFFTTREPGIGTGLGLSVSYYIVHDQHNGFMNMESEVGKGTKLIIGLPLEV